MKNILNTSSFNLLISLFSIILLTSCSTNEAQVAEEFSLSTARFGHASVNDGKNLYVLAGSNKSGFLSDIEIIDPVTKKIEVLENKLIPRRYFSAVWDGKHSIYIVGGVSVKRKRLYFEKRVEVFNTITKQVSFAPSLPTPTRINSAVFLKGNIFVFGGTYPTDGGLIPSSVVTVLKISENKWVRAADMPTAKSTRAVERNGLIYVVGGYNTKTALNVFEQFDPRLNQWKTLPPLPVKISAHSVSLVDDKLFVFGNYNSLQSTYSYDFLSQKWQEVFIGYKASRHNAATTLNNITYVTGGTLTGKGPFLDYIQAFNLSK